MFLDDMARFNTQMGYAAVFMAIVTLTLGTSPDELVQDLYHESFYVWDTVIHPEWQYFHIKVCGKYCVNNTLINERPCTNLNCFQCDCNKYCSLTGTCCPSYDWTKDEYGYNDEISHEKSKNSIYDWATRIRCVTLPHPLSEVGYKFLTILDCPPVWKNPIVRELCERPGNFVDETGFPKPYYHPVSGVIFPNVYCAICNGLKPDTDKTKGIEHDHHIYDDFVDDNLHEETETVWNNTAIALILQIKCMNYQNLYKITDQYEFYQESLKENDCIVSFSWPKPTEPPKICRESVERLPPTTKECQWPNPETEYQCYTLPAHLGLSVSGHKNLFCSMCNSSIAKEFNQQCPSWIVPDEFHVPPVYLLFSPDLSLMSDPGYVEENVGTIRPCPVGEWRNEKGICELAECALGKTLRTYENNASCETVFTNVQGLEYKLDLILHLVGNGTPEFIPKLNDAIVSLFDSKSSEATVFAKYTTHDCFTATNNYQVSYVNLKVILFSPQNVPRDKFEKNAVMTILQNDWIFNISYNSSHSNVEYTDEVMLKVVSIGSEMRALYNALLNAQCSKNNILFQDYPSYTMTFDRYSKLIDFSPTLTCPFVSLNLTSISRTNDGTLVLTVALQDDKEFNITHEHGRGQFLVLPDGRLSACLDLAKQLNLLNSGVEPASNKQPKLTRNDLLLFDIAYYLDCVCTSISVLCLFISFITYCLFPSLRGLPGLNNMCLCLSLTTAQTSLLVISVFGVHGRMDKTHCLIQGIVFHYSWLTSWCWMNVCTIHMYRVFTSNQAPNAWAKNKTHLKYCLHSFGTPGLIIITTIIVTYVSTKGGSIGYSDKVCLLDVFTSPYIGIGAFLVPCSLALMSNTVLFALTVKEVVTVRRLQQTTLTSRNSGGVVTYFKLSSVTGAFCAVTVVGVLLNDPLLIIFSCPLSSLIGVFIFVSFICNNHVKDLYRELINKHCSGRLGQLTNDTTTTTVTDNRHMPVSNYRISKTSTKSSFA